MEEPWIIPTGQLEDIAQDLGIDILDKVQVEKSIFRVSEI